MPSISGTGRSMICMLAFTMVSPGMDCSEQRREMSHHLEFRFCEFCLRKQGDFVAVTVKPVWRDAQTPPSADFDETPQTVLIDAQDLAKMWRQVEQIDFARLQSPVDSDFISTAPDVSHVESLRLVADGDTVVDWRRDLQLLVDPLRKPLEGVARQLQELHHARMTELVVPNRLSLTMGIRKGEKTRQYQLRRNAALVVIERLDGESSGAWDAKKLTQEESGSLWEDLIKLKVMDIPYGLIDLYDWWSPSDSVWSMTAVVENVEVVQFSFPAAFHGQKEFNLVWGKLESIWERKK